MAINSTQSGIRFDENLQTDFRSLPLVAKSDSVAVTNGTSTISNAIGSNNDSSAEAANFDFYLIGLLLTATALAKLWMLITDSFGDVRVGIPKEILWLSGAFELWLAFENFRIRDHRVLWPSSTRLFLVYLPALDQFAGCWVMVPAVVLETLNYQPGCSF